MVALLGGESAAAAGAAHSQAAGIIFVAASGEIYLGPRIPNGFAVPNVSTFLRTLKLQLPGL